LRAAKREDVPVNELKFALIRIEIMICRPHPTDRIVNVLNSAKLALGDTVNDII
jgi:hypothetical protein